MKSTRCFQPIWVVAFAFLLSFGVSHPAAAQTGVQILVVDDFAGRALGFLPAYIPNPFTNAQSLGLEMIQVAESALTNDPAISPLDEDAPANVDLLLNKLANYTVQSSPTFETVIQEAINAELGVPVTDPIPSDAYCAGHLPEFTTEGQGHYITQGAGPDDPGPHGDVVLDTLLQAAGSPSFAISGSDPIDIDTPYGLIQVHQADTEYFSLEAIESAIVSQVKSSPDSPWVINASFAIIPCQQVALFSEYEAIIAAADTAGEVAILDETVRRLVGTYQRFYRPGQPLALLDCEASPLCSFLEVPRNPNADVVFVAAAGNLGLSYPFYPAGFESAVSVSASDEYGPFYSTVEVLDEEYEDFVCYPDPNGACSNYGEVLMPGRVDYNGIPAFGTSFAAPRLSLRLAGYLLVTQGDNSCKLLASTFDNEPLDALMSRCTDLDTTRSAIFMD